MPNIQAFTPGGVWDQCRVGQVVVVNGEPEQIEARRSQMLVAGGKNVLAAEEGSAIRIQDSHL